MYSNCRMQLKICATRASVPDYADPYLEAARQTARTAQGSLSSESFASIGLQPSVASTNLDFNRSGSADQNSRSGAARRQIQLRHKTRNQLHCIYVESYGYANDRTCSTNHDIVSGCLTLRGLDIAATKNRAPHPILQRFNANTDWVSVCSVDRQCSINNRAACAKSMISCLSGAGIAHRLPGLGAMIEPLILFHML